jgi:hypothetical protein
LTDIFSDSPRDVALCSFEGPPGALDDSGGYGERETPLPIPNREVKPLSADGTWPSRARESRTPPVNFHRASRPSGGSSAFCFGGPTPISAGRGTGRRAMRGVQPRGGARGGAPREGACGGGGRGASRPHGRCAPRDQGLRGGRRRGRYRRRAEGRSGRRTCVREATCRVGRNRVAAKRLAVLRRCCPGSPRPRASCGPDRRRRW